MRKVIICVLMITGLLAGCKNKTAVSPDGGEAPVNEKLLTGIVDSILQAYTERYDLEHLQPLVKDFYQQRDFRFAWVGEEGVNEKAHDFVKLLRQEVMLSPEDSLARRRLIILYEYLSHPDYEMETYEFPTEFDLLATAGFFEYARRNYEGVSEEDSKWTNWKMSRKKIDYMQEIHRFFKSDLAAFEENAPVHYQYKLLQKQLRKYLDIRDKGGWTDWTGNIRELRPGETDSIVPQIKRQLFLLGDLAAEDTGTTYDQAMEQGVRHFQMRHGLAQTGVISGKTLEAFKATPDDRIRQILINMERFRWLPASIPGDHLMVNIPAFRLWVCQDEKVLWACNVIVGKTTDKTVIFNDSLETVVFSPYWNIPPSILKHEVVPALSRRPGYLAANNMEVVTNSGRPVSPGSVDWSRAGGNFPYVVRQRPGSQNSLGWVKFLFPNRYDIYLHDTPARSLFSKETRAFSHGCIRVEEPLKLAEHLLRDEKAWTSDRIRTAMYSGKQKFVRVRPKVPVFIGYFTAWVDGQGNLDLRNDVYDYDEKVADVLFF